MIESKGPTFPEPLSTPEDLKRLKTPDLKVNIIYIKMNCRISFTFSTQYSL